MTRTLKNKRPVILGQKLLPGRLVRSMCFDAAHSDSLLQRVLDSSTLHSVVYVFV